MRCSSIRSADGPELDAPVLDYVVLIALLAACLVPLLLH